nr:MAG TPA: hypothetical protein [Caudoviricetes sp.]
MVKKRRRRMLRLPSACLCVNAEAENYFIQ